MNNQESIVTKLSALPNVWKAEAKIEWVVDGMLPVGSVNLISSESGTGKTWFAHAIAGAVSRGEPFIGLEVKRAPVLYLDGENPVGVVKDRLLGLAIPETPGLYLWGGWIVNDPPFGPADPRAEEFASQTHGLMIWDSLIEFHTGDESSATETRKFMKNFRNLANHGATVLILHHAGKSSTAKRYRGSSDIKAAVDTAYTLEKVQNPLQRDKLRILTMKNFKSRFAEGRDFKMEFVPGEGFLATGEHASGAPDAKGIALEDLLTPEPINGTEFKRRAKAQGVTRDSAEAFLRAWPHKKAGDKPKEKLYYRPKVS